MSADTNPGLQLRSLIKNSGELEISRQRAHAGARPG
jgi:hypothetical protein